MAAHIIRYDQSHGSSVLVACVPCGRTLGVTLTMDKARALGDRHRANLHPRQATFAASKRRTRAVNAAPQ